MTTHAEIPSSSSGGGRISGSSGFGVASLILGITTLLYVAACALLSARSQGGGPMGEFESAVISLFGYVGIACGVLPALSGVIFGFLAHRKRHSKLAIVGIVLNSTLLVPTAYVAVHVIILIASRE